MRWFVRLFQRKDKTGKCEHVNTLSFLTAWRIVNLSVRN